MAWRLPHLRVPLPTSHLTLKPHGHCLCLDLGNTGNDTSPKAPGTDSLQSPSSAVVTPVDPLVHPRPHFATPDPGWAHPTHAWVCWLHLWGLPCSSRGDPCSLPSFHQQLRDQYNSHPCGLSITTLVVRVTISIQTTPPSPPESTHSFHHTQTKIWRCPSLRGCLFHP